MLTSAEVMMQMVQLNHLIKFYILPSYSYCLVWPFELLQRIKEIAQYV